jgi:hypothetical protein
MKMVLVLTALGLSMLGVLACRSSTPPPAAAAPVRMPEQPPTVELVQEIEPWGHVLTPEEMLLLKREGTLDESVKPDEVVVYDRMSRAGPMRHLKVKQPAKAEDFLGVSPGPAPKEHRFYSRAGPFKNRPVKTEVPVAKKD